MHSLKRNRSIIKIIESWATTTNPLNSTHDILDWIQKKNATDTVRIRKIDYDWKSEFWHYDQDKLGIVNDANSFFQIKGIRSVSPEGALREQPIIIQDEIGYLGIICKIIDGVMYFLMQAKVEPGNVNKYQISPTIQATKSNFMRAHGGKEPSYLSYFSHREKHEVIADQIQSEQSSRFLGKRNRNIIIVVEDDVEVLESHRWMTLGQICELMRYDNLVNMDTRTVLSCIPFALRDYSYVELDHISELFDEESLFNSLFLNQSYDCIGKIYQYLNDWKMMNASAREIVDLCALANWRFAGGEFLNESASFKIVFCDIEVEGREVRRWQQPLLEAVGQSIFGLIYRVSNSNIVEFLVQAKPEIGCFDRIELAPTVQKEPTDPRIQTDVDKVFFKHLDAGQGVQFQRLFSEEGGRFYHEQNRNVIVQIDGNELQEVPNGYFWTEYATLNTLVQFNNCLNIQLRNLLSTLNPRGFAL